MEENAETLCKDTINKSIETDPDNPEPYQLMASFLLSKDKEKVKFT